MFAFIVRRLLFLPVVFFGVTIFIVLLMQLLTPIQRASTYAQTPQQARNLPEIVERYGLDDPWYQQYGRWLSQVAQGNMGYSKVTNEPVLTTIRKRFPATLELALYAIIPVIGIGIWLGTAAALNRDKFIDQFTRVAAIVGFSLPSFVAGIWLLVVFYGMLGGFLSEFLGGAFRVEPGRLSTRFVVELASADFQRPTGLLTIDSLINGRFDIFWNAVLHMILPVTTLAIISSAQILRVMRSSLLDVLSQDYVRTARAKGLPQNMVNYKHARRNALIPVITLSGLVLFSLFNGVVITETVFNYPGLGQWGATAATQLDYAAVLGFAVFTAMIVVIANLLVDILYGVIDPRIRYN